MLFYVGVVAPALNLVILLSNVYSYFRGDTMADGLSNQVDATNLYRRAEVERRIARGILDGRDESELCELLGLPGRDVKGIVNRLAQRVQNESAEIARIHAIKQTGALMALYLDAEKQWQETKDPRYAEQMRGSLSDIRKIWGVDAPQRIALGGSLNVSGGVLGGVLGGLDDRTLDFLDRLLEGGNPGTGQDGEGIPSLEGLCEVGLPVPVDRGEAH